MFVDHTTIFWLWSSFPLLAASQDWIDDLVPQDLHGAHCFQTCLCSFVTARMFNLSYVSFSPEFFQIVSRLPDRIHVRRPTHYFPNLGSQIVQGISLGGGRKGYHRRHHTAHSRIVDVDASHATCADNDWFRQILKFIVTDKSCVQTTQNRDKTKNDILQCSYNIGKKLNFSTTFELRDIMGNRFDSEDAFALCCRFWRSAFRNVL